MSQLQPVYESMLERLSIRSNPILTVSGDKSYVLIAKTHRALRLLDPHVSLLQMLRSRWGRYNRDGRVWCCTVALLASLEFQRNSKFSVTIVEHLLQQDQPLRVPADFSNMYLELVKTEFKLTGAGLASLFTQQVSSTRNVDAKILNVGKMISYFNGAWEYLRLAQAQKQSGNTEDTSIGDGRASKRVKKSGPGGLACPYTSTTRTTTLCYDDVMVLLSLTSAKVMLRNHFTSVLYQCGFISDDLCKALVSLQRQGSSTAECLKPLGITGSMPRKRSRSLVIRKLLMKRKCKLTKTGVEAFGTLQVLINTMSRLDSTLIWCCQHQKLSKLKRKFHVGNEDTEVATGLRMID